MTPELSKELQNAYPNNNFLKTVFWGIDVLKDKDKETISKSIVAAMERELSNRNGAKSVKMTSHRKVVNHIRLAAMFLNDDDIEQIIGICDAAVARYEDVELRRDKQDE